MKRFVICPDCGARLGTRYLLELIYTKEYKKELVPTFRTVISHLNDRAGRRYNWETKSYQNNIATILSRINTATGELFTVADLMAIIDCKAAEWNGIEQAKYLTTETLFGGRAQKYYDQWLCEQKPCVPKPQPAVPRKVIVREGPPT